MNRKEQKGTKIPTDTYEHLKIPMIYSHWFAFISVYFRQFQFIVQFEPIQTIFFRHQYSSILLNIRNSSNILVPIESLLLKQLIESFSIEISKKEKCKIENFQKSRCIA